MEIANGAPEEEPTDCSQDGVAEIPMKERHRAGLDSALEAIAHHQIVAPSQLLHEWLEAVEVVTVVGVPHDDIASPRRLYPSKQSASVSLLGDVYNTCSEALCELGRAIVAAVVGYEYLAVYPMAGEVPKRLLHANADGFGLVQAGHQDRQLAAVFLSGFDF